MKIIGLTGGSGSGKGAVGKILATIGIPTIDTDAIYREMTETDSPCLRALVAEFGNDIISEPGTLNRKALAEIVFSGDGADERRASLNKISHKFILNETRRRLNEFSDQGYRFAVVDAPVLFESGFEKECEVILCVTADKDVRIARIMQRDHISESMALIRVDSQMSDDEIIARSDYLIVNNGDLKSLDISVKDTIRQIKMNK